MATTRNPPFSITRRWLLGGLAATAATTVVPFASAAPGNAWSVPPNLSALVGSAFGTRWRATLATAVPGKRTPESRFADIERRMLGILDEVDHVFSPYRQDAELARLNRRRSDGPVVLSPELASVLETALHIADRSDGRFDPTVGPVLHDYGLGPIVGDRLPDYRDLRLRDSALLRARPALTVDLCGIAKGHALDRLIDMLLDAGEQHALVEVGGEVRAIGQHPHGRPWRVGIADPRLAAGPLDERTPIERRRATRVVATVAPGNRALATSGLAESVYRLQDRWVHHLIDPRTAAPVVSALRSASVLAHDASTADAWATALLAAGDEAAELARTQQIDCLLLAESAAGELAADTIGDFPVGALVRNRL